MKTRLTDWVKRNQNWLAAILIAGGVVFYFVRSLHYADTIPSTVWDEGMYLVKGYLFTAGEHRPFEDGGLWTNQLPFAYFFSGIAQVLFAPGLRTGRYYAIALGLLSLIGMMAAAYRLRGKWWAAGMGWVIALNTGWVMAFSQFTSQGMVSVLLAWMLFLLAGKKERRRDMVLAAFLAGLAGMVRINVLPLVVLVTAYIFWRKGPKFGWWAAAAGLLPVVFFHTLYWPDILKIWAYWIPEKVFPPIASYRSPWREIFLPDDFSWWRVGEWWGDKGHLAWRGISIFVDALRANIVPLFGVILALVFLPRREGWKSERERKYSIFLLASFGVMLAVHVWAAMGGNTCQFSCMPGYFLFFNWLGLMAIAASAGSWRRGVKMGVFLFLIALVFVTLVVFEHDLQNDFRDFRTWVVLELLGADRDVLDQQDPTLADPTLLGGWLESLGVDRIYWLRFVWLNDFLTRVLWWLVPALVVVVPVLVGLVLRIRQRGREEFRRFVLLGLLAVLILLAPIPLFAQPMRADTCEASVLDRQEETGAQLAAAIPAGSQVFWDLTEITQALYLPEVEFFLPQQNARFTMVDDPDADPKALTRFGWWNAEMGETWIEQADYVILEKRFYDELWRWDRRVRNGEFEVVLQTRPYQVCGVSQTDLILLARVP